MVRLCLASVQDRVSRGPRHLGPFDRTPRTALQFKPLALGQIETAADSQMADRVLASIARSSRHDVRELKKYRGGTEWATWRSSVIIQRNQVTISVSGTTMSPGSSMKLTWR